MEISEKRIQFYEKLFFSVLWKIHFEDRERKNTLRRLYDITATYSMSHHGSDEMCQFMYILNPEVFTRNILIGMEKYVPAASLQFLLCHWNLFFNAVRPSMTYVFIMHQCWSGVRLTLFDTAYCTWTGCLSCSSWGVILFESCLCLRIKNTLTLFPAVRFLFHIGAFSGVNFKHCVEIWLY